MFDTILSMYDLSFMVEGEIPAAIQELGRVTSSRVFVLVHVCGTRYEVPHCAAQQVRFPYQSSVMQLLRG
jgi:hypothetical protein